MGGGDPEEEEAAEDETAPGPEDEDMESNEGLLRAVRKSRASSEQVGDIADWLARRFFSDAYAKSSGEQLKQAYVDRGARAMSNKELEANELRTDKVEEFLLVLRNELRTLSMS